MEGLIRVGIHIFYHHFFFDFLCIFFLGYSENVGDEFRLIDMGVEISG
jgi:hypothetical protein